MRRSTRLQPPIARPGFHLYRSDGAARGQGRRESRSTTHRHTASWGCAHFGNGNANRPEQIAYACLAGAATNNIAEYTGLEAAISHARSMAYDRCCFQVDSMLVARQVRGEWACRDTNLQPLLAYVWSMMREMERAGKTIIVEHIYREFNTEADALANRALDTQSSQDWVRV